MPSPILGSRAIARGELTRGQLRWRYAALHPDVYLEKTAERTLAASTAAAALWIPGSVVAGRAAAAIHGVSWVDADTPVELIGAGRRRREGVIVREERIGDDETTRIGGLVVTTPVRTGLDLARHLPRLQAVAHLDALAAASGIDAEAILNLASRYPGARGVRRARTVVPEIDHGAQSPKETWLRLVVTDAGFPRPRTQIRVSDGTSTAFIDMGWEGPRIGLEYDGEQHRGDRLQFVRDIGRHEMLGRLGWTVIRVVKEHSRAFIVRRVSEAFRIARARSA